LTHLPLARDAQKREQKTYTTTLLTTSSHQGTAMFHMG